MPHDKTKQAYCDANASTIVSCAVVVFTDSNSMPWSRWLAHGFKHCFVAIAIGAAWVVIDTLSGRTNVLTVPRCSAEDLAQWYQDQGYQTIITQQRIAPARPAPWALLTCVEVIKRLLGIHNYRIQTPKQLSNFLNSENNP